jgi:hypothetical protein
MDWTSIDWAAVAVLGGLVGASELISRYKDNPFAALKTWPGVSYISINSIASVAVLGLLRRSRQPAHAHRNAPHERLALRFGRTQRLSKLLKGRWPKYFQFEWLARLGGQSANQMPSH